MQMEEFFNSCNYSPICTYSSWTSL